MPSSAVLIGSGSASECTPQKPDPATYIGSCKAAELREIIEEAGADTVACDGELSPSQLVHLEDVVRVKVVDRTALILDIFAQHAKSREGKAQVALAQMQYMLPRLRGWGQPMSRADGRRSWGRHGDPRTRRDEDRDRPAAASRADGQTPPGNRPVEDRTGRQARGAAAQQGAVGRPRGYTNAGKFSLLNRLTGAGVLVENALFATLDTKVRRAETPSGRTYTIADTVGFVRHLPHHLVEAFRSTIDEVADADLVLHVVDGSHPEPEAQLASVREVLAEVGAGGIREVVVVNKADAADPDVLFRLLEAEPGSIAVSARTGDGIEALRDLSDVQLPRPEVEIEAMVPYTQGGLASRAHQEGEVLSAEHTEQGTLLKAGVWPELASVLRAYPQP
ncbi:GTPase HflX [Streptomyces sp. NBC_01240]|nr:GTPase HflX [Streptomyces sp. NBC_01321]WSP53258.1 GTPase HflX [Streptomyces sp. NBC_01241]WSP66906.1 GTPase HflX [Streptomyces sp. NBC_01240]WSU26060.1 GTPase HflX [Streptomyces sp. NBC_01108]